MCNFSFYFECYHENSDSQINEWKFRINGAIYFVSNRYEKFSKCRFKMCIKPDYVY